MPQYSVGIDTGTAKRNWRKTYNGGCRFVSVQVTSMDVEPDALIAIAHRDAVLTWNVEYSTKIDWQNMQVIVEFDAIGVIYELREREPDQQRFVPKTEPVA